MTYLTLKLVCSLTSKLQEILGLASYNRTLAATQETEPTELCEKISILSHYHYSDENHPLPPVVLYPKVKFYYPHLITSTNPAAPKAAKSSCLLLPRPGPNIIHSSQKIQTMLQVHISLSHDNAQISVTLKVGESGVTSMMAGPAIMLESVKLPELSLVKKT